MASTIFDELKETRKRIDYLERNLEYEIYSVNLLGESEESLEQIRNLKDEQNYQRYIEKQQQGLCCASIIERLDTIESTLTRREEP